MAALTTTFDYADMSADTRAAVQKKANAIRGMLSSIAQWIIDIGWHLIDCKALLTRGQWLPWLKAEFGWSHDSAARFMNVARSFSEISQTAKFDRTALYLLADPKVSDKARQEALQLASQGKKITYQAARQIVARHTETGMHQNYDEDDEDGEEEEKAFEAMTLDEQYAAVEAEQEEAKRKAAPLARPDDRTRQLARGRKHIEKALNAYRSRGVEGQPIVALLEEGLRLAAELEAVKG